MGVIGAVFLLSRFLDLGTWVFLLNDEAIELHRALLIHDDLSRLWLPNVEFKPPLFYWIAAVLVGIVQDPIVALRLISVLASLGTLVVLMVFVHRVGDRITALVAGSIYVVTPYCVLFDRTGFMETFVAFLGLSAFAMLVTGKDKGRWGLQSVAIGFLLGLAFFTKQSALLFFPFPILWVLADRRKDGPSWAGLALIYLIPAGFLAAMVLLPDIPSMWEGDADGTSALMYHESYRLTFTQIIELPWQIWLDNVRVTTQILADHFPLPMIILACAGVFFRIRSAGVRATTLWLVLPIAAVLVISTDLSGRAYMLAFLSAPIAALAAVGMINTWRRVRRRFGVRSAAAAVALIIGALGSSTLTRDFRLLTDPVPALEGLRQRVLAPPILSEYKLKEATDRLLAIAAHGKIHVITDQSFGMPSDGLAVHLWNREEIRLFYVWWINEMSIPMVPDSAIMVFESNHHRTTEKLVIQDGELQAHPVYWFVNSLRYPSEFVQERVPGAEVVFSLPSPDGATLDLYRLAGH